MEHLEQYTLQSTPEDRDNQLNKWYDNLQDQHLESNLAIVDVRQPNYEWQGITYD